MLHQLLLDIICKTKVTISLNVVYKLVLILWHINDVKICNASIKHHSNDNSRVCIK